MDAREERKAPTNNSKHEEVKKVRKVIIVVLLIVTFGYLFMWLLLPTSLFRSNWRYKLREGLNSTYYGSRGVSLLFFTFPVLFVAVLGSVYLHLGKKFLGYETPRKEEKTTRSRWLATWRRPVLVKGPLGIVSGIELSFLIMFIVLLVWSLTHMLNLGYSEIEVEEGGKRWLYKWEETQFRIALTGNICLSLLFYPVTRGSSILPLLGLTSEGSIKYHIWLGHMTMAIFTAHGLGFVLFWAVNGEISQVLEWSKTDVHVAGELALFFGLILWASATFPRIRRKCFEVFYYTHHLYILLVIFYLFHVGIGFAYYVLPSLYLFVLDRYLRFLQSSQRVRLLSARVLPSSEALELNFAKSAILSYNPTSMMFINIPSISKLQWHPFTVTSSSNLEKDRLSVLIKVEGKWTSKLRDIVSSSSIDRLQVSVEGPYGPATNQYLRHDMLVMVSGGSGIAPLISVIRELVFASSIMKCQTPKILLVCSFKKTSDLSMLKLLLPLHGVSSDLSSLDIQIKAYVTREQEQTGDCLHQPENIIWFKPNTTDSLISPCLGSNSWLWIGATIASSFVGFLVFMGLLTAYHIYPIDQRTDGGFSFGATTAYYVLILCGCMIISASGAFLWNKKKNAMEATQIMNMEGMTPQSTPQSIARSYDNADREVESLPHKSILDSTQVHYGERADLKKILLFDCKGSSIGVLVSGPRGMRHEVAAICGSGLVENLHFESASFSW